MNSPSRPQDDASLWSDWNRAHAPAVRGYLLALVRRPDLADDLVQEVFCRAWQARGRYREEGNVRAYLLRIADRLACDRARRSGREVNVSEEDWRRLEPAQDGRAPDDAAAQREVLEQLAAALDSLSPVQRRVLLLRYFGQVRFSEIADMVGCPLSTALSHAHRGLLALRRLLVKTVE